MSTPTKPSPFGPEQAAEYDQRFAKIQALREALYLLTAAVLAPLPAEARILCVGAGTGLEMEFLARRYAGWHFTAVEPSAAMLAVCKRRAESAGFAERCTFHEGYLESLPASAPFHAATSLLVSHFILEQEARLSFFAEISQRLQPEGMLVNADLAGDQTAPEYERLLGVWFELMRMADVAPEKFEGMRQAYARDVAFLPLEKLCGIIASGGFEMPTQFLQTGLIRAWFARRRAA